MRVYIVLIIFLMYSCSKNEKVKLEIVSDKILVSKHDYGRIKNIIEYKITNNTDCDYYFNAYSLSKLTWKIKGLQPSNVFFQILDENENFAEYDQKEYLPTEKFITCETRGEERAIKYAENCVFYPEYIKNINVVKVGNINE